MGHREDLLEGAKRCLRERGYARTTARDIVRASGTNLASIGYHFGSKDALLNLALMEAVDEWGDGLVQQRLASPLATSPMERFERTWTTLIESLEAHRPLWLAIFEAVTQAEHSAEVKQALAETMQRGRERIARQFADQGPADDTDAGAVGAFFQALMLGVLSQWLVDPDRAPSGHDLAEGLRGLARATSAG